MNTSILQLNNNYSILYFIYITGKIIINVCLIISISAYMSFIERKLLALFQNRYGPNTVGWYGCMQLIADMIKIIFKEDWIPNFSDKKIFVLSPIIGFLTAIITFSIIPITPDWIISDFNIGILFFLMIQSLSIYSILLSGWSSNNKYSLLGSIRATAQTLSYEVFLGLSMMGVVLRSDSFNLKNIILSQQHLWNIIPQFFGFITFIIAGLSLCHRHPFDQPESEQELAHGYHIEYSGIKFSLFFITEYIGLLTISSLTVTLFFGGWLGPFFKPIYWFIIKNFLCITLFILIRASLPRPRFDQIISFGWTICLPITLLNLLITATTILLTKPI